MRLQKVESRFRTFVKTYIVVTFIILGIYIAFCVKAGAYKRSTVVTINYVTYICSTVICDVLLFSCAMDKNRMDRQAVLYVMALLVFPFEILLSSLITSSAIFSFNPFILSMVRVLECVSDAVLLILCFFYACETQKLDSKRAYRHLYVIIPIMIVYYIAVIICGGDDTGYNITLLIWILNLSYMSSVVIRNRRTGYETISLLCLFWTGTLFTLLAYLYDGFYPYYLGVLIGLLLCFSNVYIKKSDILGDTEKDLNLSANIQLNMLPKDFNIDDFDNIDLYASMRPAKEIGGDFYDFYRTDKKHLVFVIADVSGKGASGAMMMMRAITSIRNFVTAGLSLDKVAEMASNNINEHNDTMMFVTAWMGRLNVENGELEFVNAGHNPPLIRHEDGRVTEINSRPDQILGFFPEAHFRLQRIFLHSGDTFYLYTDGVTESCNTSNEQYGMERLEAVLSQSYESSEELCSNVIKSVDSFASGLAQFDDMTMMAINYSSPNNHLKQN